MRKVLAVAVALLLIVACSGETVDPAKVLRDGGAALGRLKTVTATLKLTKGDITIEGFRLVSAKTSIRIPKDSDTTYTVKQQDVSFSIQVVIVGGRTYLHVPFSTFQEVTGAEAQALPDMAKLFDTTTGLPAVIPLGQDPKYVSSEQVNGRDCYQVSTGYTADQVKGLLSEFNSTGTVSAHVWVDKSDHVVRKATLSGPFGDSGVQATVEVDISSSNGPVVISSPTP